MDFQNAFPSLDKLGIEKIIQAVGEAENLAMLKNDVFASFENEPSRESAFEKLELLFVSR